MRASPLGIVLLCLLIALVSAWSKEDHEIFRLKDEVEASEGPGVTFYNFIGITPSATQEELNKAYKKKSRQIHPDKARQAFIASRAKPSKKKKSGAKPGVHVSKPPSEREIQRVVKEANQRFGRLGIVAKILRGEGRERYDHFLRNGFPKWRGTGYYYARFRPGLGSVLLGLFIVGGGLAHYGALRLSWSRQRDFVGRYIREARKAAWGDETGIRGLAGLGESATAPTPLMDSDPAGGAALNRKQKRQQEKETRKEKKAPKAAGRSGTQTPVDGAATTPQGEKRRVTAENGKVLIVDSSGNVFLEEEDEDGNTELFLLDVDEIPQPTWKDTAVYRFPVWSFKKTVGLFRRDKAPEPKTLDVHITVDEPKEDDDSSFEIVRNEPVSMENVEANGKARKRGKKGSKK